MALKGVNLGGWLVLERWITPSLFKETEAKDELSLSYLSEEHRQRIARHHKTFITEKDFQWLKRAEIEAIRIPIGYWIFGDEKQLVGSKVQLDWALNMATKYNIKVLISIHGAAGSQNGKQHSGKIGATTWYHPKNKQKTLVCIEKLSKVFGKHEALWGIELLNEPKVGLFSLLSLFFYYAQAKKYIRKECSSSVRIIIGGDNGAGFWALYGRFMDFALDRHLYHSFGRRNRFRSTEIHYQKAMKSAEHIKKLQSKTPLIIGEWSGVLGTNMRKYHTAKEADHLWHAYIEAQIKSYDAALAWFYWTYKTEQSGVWNFRDSTEKGIITLV